MTKLALEVKGVGKLLAQLMKSREDARRATFEQLLVEGHDIEARSAEKCPVDTGNLRSSARVSADPDGGTVTVGYYAPYAIVVHERLDVHHNIGEAKFLERAVDEVKPGLSQRVANRVKKKLGL